MDKGTEGNKLGPVGSISMNNLDACALKLPSAQIKGLSLSALTIAFKSSHSLYVPQHRHDLSPTPTPQNTCPHQQRQGAAWVL